jgi:hypothetical protein
MKLIKEVKPRGFASTVRGRFHRFHKNACSVSADITCHIQGDFASNVTSLPTISLWITGHLSGVFRPQENKVRHFTNRASIK